MTSTLGLRIPLSMFHTWLYDWQKVRKSGLLLSHRVTSIINNGIEQLSCLCTSWFQTESLTQVDTTLPDSFASSMTAFKSSTLA